MGPFVQCLFHANEMLQCGPLLLLHSKAVSALQCKHGQAPARAARKAAVNSWDASSG